MPFVKSEIVIKGEKQKIFDVIQDMASYPKFMKNLVSVEVLEKGEIMTFPTGYPTWTAGRSSGPSGTIFTRKPLRLRINRPQGI